jgi:hypothetical protein
MEEKILNETTTFCMECPDRECCPEEECILYRIEQILTKRSKEDKPVEGQTNIYDYIKSNE